MHLHLHNWSLQTQSPKASVSSNSVSSQPAPANRSSRRQKLLHLWQHQLPLHLQQRLAGITKQAVVAAWPEILSQVKAESKSAWVVAFTLTVMDLSGDVLTLKFLSQKDLDGFKADSRSTDALRKAIFAVLGLQVKFKPHVEAAEASCRN
jgi:hypothetical protein